MIREDEIKQKEKVVQKLERVQVQSRFVSGGREKYAHYFWLLLSLLVASCAFRDVSSYEFTGDARFLIQTNSFITDIGYFWETLLKNYFWSSSGNIIPYWRPVTKTSWLFEYQLFGQWNGGYQVVSLLWFLLMVAGVGHLARSLGLSALSGGIASLLVSIHPVTVAPVSMVMARSDVVCACCVVWAVSAWLRWLGGGRRWLFLHILFILLALGSKEGAVILPVLLLVWIVVKLFVSRPVPGNSGDSSGKGFKIVEFHHIFPAIVLAAVYMILRYNFLYMEAEGLESISLDTSPLRFLTSYGVYITNLFPFSISSDVMNISVEHALDGMMLFKSVTALIVFAGLVCLALWGRRDAVLFTLAWVLIAILPVVLNRQIWVPAVEGKFPMADRWLFHSLVPAVLAFVAFCGWGWKLLPVSKFSPRSSVKALLSFLVGLLVIGFVLYSEYSSREVRLEYADEMGFIRNENRYFAIIPERYRSSADICRNTDRVVVRHMLLGEFEDAARIGASHLRECGPQLERNLNLFLSHLHLGNCSQAAEISRLFPDKMKYRWPIHAKMTGICIEKARIADDQEGEAFWLKVREKFLSGRG